MVADRDFRRGSVRPFEAHPRTEPVLRIDNRETVAARLVDLYALRAEAGLLLLICWRGRCPMGDRRSEAPTPVRAPDCPTLGTSPRHGFPDLP